MTTLFKRITSGSRAAMIAAALGAATLTAMPAPAMAQSSPSFNFQLGIGNDGNGFSFGIDNGRRDFRPMRRCMNDWQIERGLRHYGFRNAEVIRDLRRNRVEAYGEWRGKGYTMKVDKCTGEVYDIERLRRGGWGRGDDRRGGGRWDDHNDGRWGNDRDDGARFEFRFGN